MTGTPRRGRTRGRERGRPAPGRARRVPLSPCRRPRRHLQLIPSAVDEMPRIEVPGDGASIWVATEDVELPSGPVRKGEAVIPSFVGPNNDPLVNDDPRRFRLDRENPTHLTFGWGPHFCLGATLARVELREVLGMLTERFPGLALAEPPDEIGWTATAIRRPTRLLVRLR
ncbi:cytochrome P450 [Sphaerisporangium sp. NPDC088356]|uniref:cytochrome P450 n=1 Tax=Sphaerisporangium sp. NPDC088356 TaxID=3154871 RepID=UPI003437B731